MSLSAASVAGAAVRRESLSCSECGAPNTPSNSNPSHYATLGSSTKVSQERDRDVPEESRIWRAGSGAMLVYDMVVESRLLYSTEFELNP